MIAIICSITLNARTILVYVSATPLYICLVFLVPSSKSIFQLKHFFLLLSTVNQGISMFDNDENKQTKLASNPYLCCMAFDAWI